MSPTPEHLIRLADLSDSDLEEVLLRSLEFASRSGCGAASHGELAAKTVGLLFFRGSLRTRASLEAAVHQLGGHAMNLTAESDFWELEEREGSVMDGRPPEHIRDAAAVLSCYVNALAIRPAPEGSSWAQDRRDPDINSWARHASVPVINMESALWHPLQALADLVTLRRTFGDLKGKRLSLVWVHSPEPASAAVAHSLLHAALRSGMDVSLAHPSGFELDGQVMAEAEDLAAARGGSLRTGLGLEDAVAGANVVYARSWMSLELYGNKTLAASNRSRFTEWKIDGRLMELGDEARLMHAMPIRRNVEVTDDVLDGPRSLVVSQAGNRLHAQKALLLHVLRNGQS